jgi:CRP/FNR family transcriptional regulator
MLATAQASSTGFHLGAISHLRHLPEDRSGILGELARTQAIGRQEVLFHEADDAASVFEIIQGVIRLCRLLPDGRRSITGFAFPSSILGLSFREAYVYTAQAITPCEVRRCGQAAVTKLLDSGPQIRRQLLGIVSDELCSAQDQMLLLGRKTAPGRLVSFLLWLAAKMAPEQTVPTHVDLPMPRGDIADYLGLTTETVSREITKLKQAGLISLPMPQRIVFVRLKTLRQIAE